MLIALFYLGKEEPTMSVITHALKSLGLEEFEQLKASRKPQWMQSALEQAGKVIEWRSVK